MKHTLSLLLLIFCVSLQAQTEQDESPPEAAATDSANVEAAASPAPQQAGSYTPSEEISEDLSVSFPVDI